MQIMAICQNLIEKIVSPLGYFLRTERNGSLQVAIVAREGGRVHVAGLITALQPAHALV